MSTGKRSTTALHDLPPMTAHWIFSGFPGALEPEFYAENLRQSLNLIRFTTLWGGIVMAGFGLVNNLILPPNSAGPWLAVFTIIRISVIAPFALFTFLMTFSKKFARIANPGLCLYALLFAVGICGRIAFSSREDPAYLLYYAGLIIVCIGLNVGVHIRFVYAAVTGALMLGMYFIAALGFNRLLDSAQGTVFFINNIFFLLATEVLGLMACFFSEYYRRNAFLLRKRIRLDEETARRKALDQWKDAYRMFQEINAGTPSKPCPAPSEAGRHYEPPAAAYAEKLKNDRMADLLYTFGARRGSGIIFEKIMDIVLEMSGSRRGAIAVRDGQSGEPVFIVRRGINQPDVELVFGVIADTLASGEPVVVNDAGDQADFPHRGAAWKSGVRSLLCFPVDLHGAAIGACYLDKGPEEDPFSGESDEMIISLVTQLILSLKDSNWQDDDEDAVVDEIRLNAQCEKLRLTPREKELALMVLKGYSKRKICDKLFISVNTLRSHLKNINSKAGVENRNDLLSYLAGNQPEQEGAPCEKAAD